MRAGQLRHRLSLQSQSASVDDIGQRVVSWTEVAKVWGDVRYMNGLEAVKSESLNSIAKASIRIRFRTGVDSSMRLVEGSTIFDIQAPLPDTTGKRYLDLACTTGASAG